MPATKTDLVDRYLHAVKFWLPKAQQKDILAELAEDLQSQIDDRAAALGHALDEAELAALLKQRGSPMKVASAFTPEKRLISPAMLVVYRLVLKVVLLWVLAPLFVVIFLGPVIHSPHPGRVLFGFLDQAIRTGFMVVGIVTVVFAAIERYQATWIEQWDPLNLPRVPGPNDSSERFKHATSFAFTLGGAVFWAIALWHRSEFVLGSLHILLAPVWQQLYWLVLGLTLADAAVDLHGVVRPGRMLVRAGLRLMLDAAGILVAVALFRAGNWIRLFDPNIPAADMATVMPWLHRGAIYFLAAAVGIKLIDAIVQIRRLVRGKPAGPAPMLTASQQSF
jgi:hypothetical protein